MRLSLFINCRYDFRRPIRIYSNATQSLTVSGLDKIREEFLCLDRQFSCVCGLQALRGLVKVCSRLFAFAGSKGEGGVGFSMRSIFDFAVGMGQRSSLFKIYPTTIHRLFEVLFAKMFLGVPIGYAVPRGTERRPHEELPLGVYLLSESTESKQHQRLDKVNIVPIDQAQG